MFETVRLLAETNFALLVFSVLIFDIPRYTLSLLSLALFGAWRRSDRVPAGNASVSVIIPTFNGGSGLGPTIASLYHQTLRPFEIIVVDDGSTDNTRAVAERARADGLVDMVICHGTRCGRSAAINTAARFASGDLLLTVDPDRVFEPTAIARLAAVFSDPRVGGASCNIAISNEQESLWTGLQSVEYLMSISAGRSILDVVDAIACLSGACSMYRRDTFLRQGGLDVGPGEDLEYSLRLLLLWISIFNMGLAFVMFNRSIGLFGLGAALIFPLYQGVYLKCARFFSYSSEIIFASSRRDDFVPPRVLRALLGDRV